MGLPMLVDEAMALSPDERDELAAILLDSLEAPEAISIDDTEEIDRRAAAALSGEDPGVPWDELRKKLAGG